MRLSSWRCCACGEECCTGCQKRCTCGVDEEDDEFKRTLIALIVERVPEPEEPEQLHAELAAMEPSALKKRAKEVGVVEGKLPEEVWSLHRPANDCLCETELPLFDASDEYDELAAQFSYVSVFTIVVPIGAIMSLARNLVEGHTDLLHTFRDFRRPVPRIIDDTAVIGEW